MTLDAKAAGTFTFPGTDLTVARMGYGAMQLGKPDPATAIAVLERAWALGVDHVDTADFYGDGKVSDAIRAALSPYPSDMLIATKVGYARDGEGQLHPATDPQALRDQVDANRRRLGLDVLPLVNLRLGTNSAPDEQSLAAPLGVLATLQREGAIKHLGLSNVSRKQIDEADGIAAFVCVQNKYNLALRDDDAMIDALAARGIAYVPWFPLGGFTPLQSDALEEVASGLDASPLQVALAWLLQRSPNILLIPGTSSIAHLEQNIAAARLKLPPEAVARLDRIGRPG